MIARRRQRSKAARANESSAFRGVRRRLALWYAGVLAALLLISGIVLYNGTTQVVTNQTLNRLQQMARGVAHRWQMAGMPPAIDSSFPRGGNDVPYIACYAPDGTLLAADQRAQTLPDFINADLAQAALAHGAANDVISNAIQRYALVVRASQSHAVLGVVQIGFAIGGEIRSEQALRTLLIIIGVVMLVVAVLSGIGLATLAMAPARLAFARQQRFIADASHELRTPLTLLQADAELLLRARDRLPADEAALAEDMLTEARHLTHLANQMLNLARLDSAAQHAELSVIDAGALLERLRHRMQPLATERAIQVAYTIPQTAALVLSDATLLEEALLIVLENAIKYNHDGGAVTLSLETLDSTVRLHIGDTGPGIAPEHLARLGERFYRVDKARSRELGGAGLGLAIARNFIKLQNGTLTIHSTVGAGTTVTIALPRVVSPHPNEV